MAAIFKIWMPLLCAIALHVTPAWSIKCWDCNSHYDPHCADPFRNATFALTDCEQKGGLEHLPGQSAVVCRKIIQKVRDDYRFVRSCGYLNNEKEGSDCFKRAGTFNVLIQYCSCEQDGCNSAPLHTIATWTLLLTLLLIFVKDPQRLE